MKKLEEDIRYSCIWKFQISKKLYFILTLLNRFCYQEVEEDKKNAAKLNALVQMVPSSDWPERKEPPEFLNPPKAKQKSAKEKHEYTLQVHATGNEGKKIHSFAQVCKEILYKICFLLMYVDLYHPIRVPL